MILTKGQSCHFNSQEHTIIETNYLGVKVQNDETGVFAFIRASEAEKVLTLVEEGVSIKPVEIKLSPMTDRMREMNYATGAGIPIRHLVCRRKIPMSEAGRSLSPEQRSANGRKGAHATNNPKPETPIEVLRERSRASAIKE